VGTDDADHLGLATVLPDLFDEGLLAGGEGPGGA
jgi:hypothetical protein